MNDLNFIVALNGIPLKLDSAFKVPKYLASVIGQSGKYDKHIIPI